MFTKEMYDIVNSLKAVGLNASLKRETAYCIDNKNHDCIFLITGLVDEDEVSIVFNPITKERVETCLDCPIV